MKDDNNLIIKGSSFYNVYYYDGRIFKVVGFKRLPSKNYEKKSKEDFLSYDKKLENSISRTKKIILDYALCNNWSFFCTFTLDKSKYNRYNLPKFNKDFSQWIRDQRKKFPGLDFKFLLIPELHDDGAWHMHGLFGDISPLLTSFKDLYLSGHKIPFKLVSGGFYNWCDYEKKFGFCSLGVIKDRIKCAFYMTKYITKEIHEGNISVGSRSVFNSYGLVKPHLHMQIYSYTEQLENVLSYHGEFCSTGMTKKSDNCDWTFSFEFDDIPLEPLFSFDENEVVLRSEDDMFYQMTMEV